MSIFHTDIAIIGAGPQALTLVTHLLQKKKKMRDRLNADLSPGFQVFDPSGTWLANWHQQFAAQEIPHLRSPAVHHPDCNSHTLLSFAEKRQDGVFCTTPQKGIVHLETGETQLFPYPHSAIAEY